MALGCGTKLMKYILVVFNLIFVLLGIIALGLGIWVIVDSSYISQLMSTLSTSINVTSLLEQGAYVLIAGGAIILVIGFLGCCGAVKEVQCMLGMYAVFLIILLIIEIVAVSLAFAYKGTITTTIKTQLKREIQTGYKGNDNADAFTLAINGIQFTDSCCGVDNSTDFGNTTAWTVNRTTIPFSCCILAAGASFPDNVILADPNCPTKPVTSNKDVGCFGAVQAKLEGSISIVAGVGLAIAFIEVMGIIFACCLCQALRTDGKAV